MTIPLEVGRRYKITKVEEKGVAIFQMPMINVSLHLIYAHNPYANPDMTNPRVPSFERRTDVLGRGSRDSFL